MISSCDRFKVLFEPVKIGPHTAKNRFFQAPHGCGVGHTSPSILAGIRRMKAEGGWAVVATEQAEIHSSSDTTPYLGLRNWDERDLPALAAIAASIKQHDALAALELSHSGLNSSNMSMREPGLAPNTIQTVETIPGIPAPFHARGMDLDDVRQLRTWHREAAIRGLQAGFDILYVFAAQLLSLPGQFISRHYNLRSDDYGGTLENRVRLLRELVEDTLEVAAGKAAVAVRLTIDDLLIGSGNDQPDLAAAFELLGELPDLWDVTINGWQSDMAGTSRFDIDPQTLSLLRLVRTMTTKPLVSVRYFESLEDMVRHVSDGLVDFVGFARQSIADPYFPRKIQFDQTHTIRRCIKCNFCVAGDLSNGGVQCTQNPTFGEEWRRGWHPEQVPTATGEGRFLIVGAGPAGLECARVLGLRGHGVTLVERQKRLGGSVSQIADLPNMSNWREVIAYREHALAELTNVKIETELDLTSDAILGADIENIVVATGSVWRKDCDGRRLSKKPDFSSSAIVLTPDDFSSFAELCKCSVLVFDDDHYVMGGLIAEHLRDAGHQVGVATPAAEVSAWTHFTMEQPFVQKRLLNLGVQLFPHRYLNSVTEHGATLECVFTGRENFVSADVVVIVAGRRPRNELFNKLQANQDGLARAGVASLAAIGDAYVPAHTAQAVRAGFRYAVEFGTSPAEAAFGRDVIDPTRER